MRAKITLSPKESVAVRFIRNHVVHHGSTPSVRDLMRGLGYRSPNSAALVIRSLIRKMVLAKRQNGDLQLTHDPVAVASHARTIDIPLVGTVACGTPILAEQNVEAHISVSTSLARPGHKYFLLRAEGDSMDLAGINDGDLVLVRQQSVADEGDRVVALIDDSATVKEYRRGKGAIKLVPRSSNKKHKPIILTDDFRIQGVVVAAVPK